MPTKRQRAIHSHLREQLRKEPLRERYEAEAAAIRSAESALAANRCPEGCGTLGDGRCAACGFRLVSVPPSVPEPVAAGFWRRPVRKIGGIQKYGGVG